LEGGDERRALARRMHLTSCAISIETLVRRIICQNNLRQDASLYGSVSSMTGEGQASYHFLTIADAL